MRYWFLAIAVLVLEKAGQAEPLDLHQVPAEITWVVHLDLDAGAKSEAAQRILENWLAGTPQNVIAQQVRQALGVNLTRDLHSLTVYGTRGSSYYDGVAIVRGKIDQDRLVALLEQQPGYKAESYGGREVHTCTRGAPQRSGVDLTVCCDKAGLVVFGRNARAVKLGLDVLDGKAESLAGRTLPLALEIPPGTVLLAGASELIDVRLPLVSPVLRHSQVLVVAVGQQDQSFFLHARLLAKSKELAAEIRTALEGMAATARLQSDSEPDRMKILEAIRVSTAGRTVTVECRAPADHVLRLLSTPWAK